jgi:hypothetical protein
MAVKLFDFYLNSAKLNGRTTEFMSVIHANISTTDQSPSGAESLRWSNNSLLLCKEKDHSSLCKPHSHCPLSWTTLIQSTSLYPTVLVAVLINSPRSTSRISNWCLPFRLVTKFLYESLISPTRNSETRHAVFSTLLLLPSSYDRSPQHPVLKYQHTLNPSIEVPCFIRISGE